MEGILYSILILCRISLLLLRKQKIYDRLCLRWAKKTIPVTEGIM